MESVYISERQRLQIYLIALGIIAMDSPGLINSLCRVLFVACQIYGIPVSDRHALESFPEIIDSPHSPKNVRLSRLWFDSNDVNSRIIVLKEAINIVNNETDNPYKL